MASGVSPEGRCRRCLPPSGGSHALYIPFVLGMLCFIGTQVMFLREILLAIASLRRQSIRRGQA